MKRSFTKFLARLDDDDLRASVEGRALAEYVSLRALYEGPGVRSITAARRSVYQWLMKSGKSLNEVARLFDRAPSGVLRLTSRR
jgi:hypothetical protein